ncbi:hypothetical protein B484DRAFT_229288 [Ochromonadaceae sp. CCMP2298]|nr:hypothetical protein B484DRAFT_229288 [Ochromonadaceae sp. CCMP2298]
MEQQAEREQATRRQYEHMRTQLQAATESTRESASLLGAALADRRDVLRLIDVMSTSPVSIKVVLETYLKKLRGEHRQRPRQVRHQRGRPQHLRQRAHLHRTHHQTETGGREQGEGRGAGAAFAGAACAAGAALDAEVARGAGHYAQGQSQQGARHSRSKPQTRALSGATTTAPC